MTTIPRERISFILKPGMRVRLTYGQEHSQRHDGLWRITGVNSKELKFESILPDPATGAPRIMKSCIEYDDGTYFSSLPDGDEIHRYCAGNLFMLIKILPPEEAAETPVEPCCAAIGKWPTDMQKALHGKCPFTQWCGRAERQPEKRCWRLEPARRAMTQAEMVSELDRVEKAAVEADRAKADRFYIGALVKAIPGSVVRRESYALDYGTWYFVPDFQPE